MSRINETLSNQSRYCYPNTDILINKLNIKNIDSLEKAEKSLSLLRLTHLQMYGLDIPFKFDVSYYLKIHYYIFQDLYPFAGEIRGENIIKGNTPFCRPEFIFNYLKETLKQMEKDLYKLTDKESVIEFLAYYYQEINIIHPFREGNGRVLREFLRESIIYINNILKTDYELDYSEITKIDRENLMNGSILASIRNDQTLLNRFFSKTLKDKRSQYERTNAKRS